MDALRQMWRYVGDNQAFFVESLRIHLQLSGVALGLAILLCVPLGIWLARRLTLATPVINLVSALRVIPSLAILFLAIPYLGLNRTAAFVALTLLALPPVLINSYAAFRGVPAAVKEAARGMGMNTWQLLWQIELPLALPVVMTGIRTAARSPGVDTAQHVFGNCAGVASRGSAESDALGGEPGGIDMVDAGGGRPDEADPAAGEQPAVDPRHRAHEQDLGVAEVCCSEAAALEQAGAAEVGKHAGRAGDLPVDEDLHGCRPLQGRSSATPSFCTGMRSTFCTPRPTSMALAT